MTVLVGVKCTDGIVIGADSIATSANGSTAIMQIEANDKISIFDSSVIVASTGSVGLAQRLNVHAQAAVKGSVFKNLAKHEAATNVSSRMIKDLGASMYRPDPHHGIGFGALLAAEIKGETHLVEYETDKFQPEFREGKLFYVSMGSGQGLADPFLAFINRVLWRKTMPDVRLGKFGVYWALSHTIAFAPGTVGPPIKIAILSKDAKGRWIAKLDENTDEAEQFIASLENRIGSGFNDEVTTSDPLPEPPAEG